MNVRMLVATALVLISASACKASNTPSGAASAPASAQQQAPAPAPQASQASAPASRASAPQPAPPARGVEQKKVEKKDEKQASAPRSAITPKFTVFDTVEECRASVLLGQVQPYKPTTKAPFQGVGGWEKKVVPEGGACLGRAHVMEDGAPKNGKAVYVPAGFVYWQHVSGSYRMAECSNPFEEISFFHKKEEIAPPVVQQETKTVVINERIEKKIEFVETVECVQGNRKVPGVIENGKVKCPDLEIAAPITINEPIRVQPRVVAPPPVVVPPAAPAHKAEAPCTDCHAEMRIERKVPRTDGRCVVALRDPQGRMHFARFDTQTNHLGPLLVGARVDNERGEWNRSYTPSYVGDGTQTVRLQQKDCEVVVRALQNQRVFAWTAPRLGLDANCTVVGPVREL